jgi:hypothetical protein
VPRFDRPCLVRAEKESSVDAVTLTSGTRVRRTSRPHCNSSDRWRIGRSARRRCHLRAGDRRRVHAWITAPDRDPERYP